MKLLSLISKLHSSKTFMELIAVFNLICSTYIINLT